MANVKLIFLPDRGRGAVPIHISSLWDILSMHPQTGALPVGTSHGSRLDWLNKEAYDRHLEFYLAGETHFISSWVGNNRTCSPAYTYDGEYYVDRKALERFAILLGQPLCQYNGIVSLLSVNSEPAAMLPELSHYAVSDTYEPLQTQSNSLQPSRY